MVICSTASATSNTMLTERRLAVGLQMTDKDAIRIAKRSPYPHVVKIPNGSYEKPHAIIVVDLDAKPPAVTRIDDEHQHLRFDK